LNEDDRLDPRVWRIAGVVLFGPLMSSLDSTIVNVSLSTLSQELHSPLTQMQWVVTGYLLTLALTLPLSGWVVDRIGARRVYLFSFIAFTLTSLGCGLSPSTDWLIFFRALQGMAGGLLALFLRGVGQGCINIPSMAAAYSSVRRNELPTATTAINIVQRLGGPVGTCLLTVFLHQHLIVAGAIPEHSYTDTFVLLCGFHALAVASALRLPARV
jgi:MFS family permease